MSRFRILILAIALVLLAGTALADPPGKSFLEGFETGNLNRWTSVKYVPSSRTDDKVRCKAGFGQGGSGCAMQFKGGAGEGTVLKKKLDVSAIPAGDTIDVSIQAWVMRMHELQNLVIKVRVIGTNGDVVASVTLTSFGPADPLTYQQLSASISNLVLDPEDDPKKAIITVKNAAPSGKTRFDSLSVSIFGTEPTR